MGVYVPVVDVPGKAAKANALLSPSSQPPSVQNNAGVEIGSFCRAWVKFNGITTVTINGSFNVSSITRNSTGNYTINFSTAMPDANYCATGTMSNNSLDCNGVISFPLNPTYSASAVQVLAHGYNTITGFVDCGIACVAVFR